MDGRASVNYLESFTFQVLPSAGGHLALWVGSQRRDAVSGVVSLSGVPDIEGDNIRVVTMYLPDSGQWDEDGRLRRAVK